MRVAEEFLQDLGSKKEETLALINEISDMVAYYKRLLERFELDTLTGLPGSNRFREFTAGLENRAKSAGVIFFDVNELKTYNDTKGHHAGDLLLQKAAESLHFLTSENVHVFRVGGDEFVVIITNREESAIDEILDKWRAKLAQLNSEDDGIHCSVAVGSAFGSGKYKIGDIMKLADERMYIEKRRRKDGAT
ncbi:MAG: GGDEF domain-containing protein [Oscillospiraceae bacterium]|nr:GGDEF domain-containing protein [Oscillospiraceae bacterium]